MKTNTKQLYFDLDITPKVCRKDSDYFVFDLMDCLRSPVITYPSAWNKDLPKDVLAKVTTERFMSLMKKKQQATICEVLLYLYPLSLERPLPQEWAEIYTWCGLQFTKLYRSKEVFEHMNTIAPTFLDRYKEDKLNSLRNWIYNKRREALKTSLK